LIVQALAEQTALKSDTSNRKARNRSRLSVTYMVPSLRNGSAMAQLKAGLLQNTIKKVLLGIFGEMLLEFGHEAKIPAPQDKRIRATPRSSNPRQNQ
jgi:hypothetical protein